VGGTGYLKKLPSADASENKANIREGES